MFFLKKYIGVKIIKAELMTKGAFNASKGVGIQIDDTCYNDTGYKVVYEDGYVSWSPKEVFEAAYRRIDNMTFGLALEALKLGKKVCRSGWNGKGMFLMYVPSEKYGIIEKIGLGIDKGNLLPWIGMKTADDKFVPWLASQTDMLSEDWIVLI